MRIGKPLIIIILFIVLGIYCANNFIADGVRKDLLLIPCPAQSSIVDSRSIARKLYGAGNGMQYTGILLITTQGAEETIKKYYQTYYPDCEVKRLNLSELKGYFSINENDDGQEIKYVVSLTRQIEDGTIPDTILFRFLSDIDIRGH